MRLFTPLLKAVLALALLCGTASVARADANSEMVVKAVMIRKFAEFVKWPDAVAPQKDMQVRVCAFGDELIDKMAPVFAKTSATNPIRFSLVTINSAAEAASCHILFVGSSRQDQLSSVLASVSGKPILTVSDASSFAEKGGMIGFQVIDGKVRYNINNSASAGAQLKVDAQLLEIANKVVG